MFDPNDVSDKKTRKLNYTYSWATYIPDRIPKFKIHGTKDQAVAAVRYRYHSEYGPTVVMSLEQDVQLFQLVDGKWVDIPLVREYNRTNKQLKSPILAENT